MSKSIDTSKIPMDNKKLDVKVVDEKGNLLVITGISNQVNLKGITIHISLPKSARKQIDVLEDINNNLTKLVGGINIEN